MFASLYRIDVNFKNKAAVKVPIQFSRDELIYAFETSGFCFLVSLPNGILPPTVSVPAYMKCSNV